MNDKLAIKLAVEQIIRWVGEDPDREGLRDTPNRVAIAWAEWCNGYAVDVPALLKTFEFDCGGGNEMVLVKDIDLFSHCEHHLAPFFGVAHVAYIPSNGRIVGLSKLARVVEAYSRRLQVQERIANQIADALDDSLQPVGVGVIIESRHMCMCSRGVRSSRAVTVTSALRGAMLHEQETRAEFMRLCGY